MERKESENFGGGMERKVEVWAAGWRGKKKRFFGGGMERKESRNFTAVWKECN